jgi:hypothetical protein
MEINSAMLAAGYGDDMEMMWFKMEFFSGYCR